MLLITIRGNSRVQCLQRWTLSALLSTHTARYLGRFGKYYRMFLPSYMKESVNRALQSFAVVAHLSVFLLISPFIFFFLPIALFTPLFFIPLLYGIWYLYDWNRSSRGGHTWQRWRESAYWRWYCDYFPIRIVKTADLDPRYKYIFGGHPHGGSVAFGFVGALSTEACGFRELYPGINLRLLGLKIVMHIPFLREYAMAAGLCDVSRESIDYLLKQGPGSAVGIVVGGNKEIYEIDSKNVNLVLKNRKGFVKAAIQNGAHLVPMFAFGENDLYRLAFHKDALAYKFLRLMHRKLHFCPGFAVGKGIFWGAGIMPFRIPITVVIGAPIPTEYSPNPTQAEIDSVHQHYLEKLRDLFDRHKGIYGRPDSELVYID